MFPVVLPPELETISDSGVTAIGYLPLIAAALAVAGLVVVGITTAYSMVVTAVRSRGKRIG